MRIASHIMKDARPRTYAKILWQNPWQNAKMSVSKATEQV